MPTDPMKRGKLGINKLNMQIETMMTPYITAEARLTSLVARAVISGTLGDPRTRRAITAQSSALLKELDTRGIPNGTQIVADAYDLGRRLAEPTSTGRVDDEALRLLQESVAGRLGDATSHVGRRVDDVFRKEGLRAAAIHYGDPGDDPSGPKALAKSLGDQGVSAFVDTKGRKWSLSTYAEMAVKTITAEAVFQGTQKVLLEKGLDLVAVNKVDNPCPQCRPYDGKVFSLTGRTKGYPILDIVFPIHPWCQHYITVAPQAFEARRAAA